METLEFRSSQTDQFGCDDTCAADADMLLIVSLYDRDKRSTSVFQQK